MIDKTNSWNVHGLGDKDKRIVIKSVLLKWNPDVVLLQETKLQDFSVQLRREVWCHPDVDYCYIPSRGTKGGISILWRKDKIDLIDKLEEIHSLSCMFRSKTSHLEFYISNIYAPNDRKDRRTLWRELREVMGIWSIPGFLGGDWNVTKSIEDRNRDRGVSRVMRDFISFITNHDLVDLPLSGAKYTWSNFRENPYCSKIDRFLLNSLWEAMFPYTIQSAKPRPVSDHTPLLLSTTMVNTGARPFKFEIIWLESAKLKDKMQVWWSNLTFNGNLGYVFRKKLMAIKEYLKVWNKECFGKVCKNMDELLVQIQETDIVDEVGVATLEECINRVNLKKDYIKWENMEHKRIKNKTKG
ncbi:uncharacterized protein LOC113352782 [Papaver somniferum]|uniref:uncharacterized protein LOC113352782 n=1 Tax=Papaver somniferum TaxID=3469 RepID=UPI000E6F67D6|nr:uncharacterized protein LOC113352782 [Papaver somniferum]